jgi:hypothetical protein
MPRRRRIGLIALLALLVGPVLATAQDRTPLRLRLEDPPARVRAEAGMDRWLPVLQELWPRIAPPVASDLGVDRPRPVEIVLLQGETFRGWARGLLPEWGVGFARWPAGPIVLDADAVAAGPKTLPEILRHELSHVYLGQRLGGMGVPRWFVEGVAQSQSGEGRLLDTWTLVRGAVGGRLPSLQKLGTAFPQGGEAARQAYAVSLQAVQRLDEEVAGGWRAMVDEAARQGRFDTAWLSLTGRSLQAFAEDFDADLQGSYGWIGALGRITTVFGVMTLLFLAAVVRALYRKHRRLAEMEAEEAEG